MGLCVALICVCGFEVVVFVFMSLRCGWFCRFVLLFRVVRVLLLDDEFCCCALWFGLNNFSFGGCWVCLFYCLLGVFVVVLLGFVV